MSVKAGRICGNPLNGLCYRMCVESKRVFDGCEIRIQNDSFVLNLTDFNGGTTPPFTFISANSTGLAAITNLVITPITDTSRANTSRANVSMDTIIPIVVSYTDALNQPGTALSSLSLHREVTLKLPPISLAPYNIEVPTTLISTIGTFIGNNQVSINCCIVQIIKLVIYVDILVPTYGYCKYPDCGGAGNPCAALLGTPLFPEDT